MLLIDLLKGILFTATYVTKFAEMENQIKANSPQISKEQELVLAIYNGVIGAVEATKELTELKVKEAIAQLIIDSSNQQYFQCYYELTSTVGIKADKIYHKASFVKAQLSMSLS